MQILEIWAEVPLHRAQIEPPKTSTQLNLAIAKIAKKQESYSTMSITG